MIEQWMAGFADDLALLDHLEKFRVPSGPVVNPADAHKHPYFAGRGTLREADDRILGKIMLPGFPLRFSEQTDYPARIAPLLGEHNESILGDMLGYAPARIEALRASKVLFAAAV